MNKKSVESVRLKYRHPQMEHVILIWRMFNIPFFIYIQEMRVMDVLLSSSQHYDIITSDVILNPNILSECITLNYKIGFCECDTHLTC